jgi:hypothetical protein
VTIVSFINQFFSLGVEFCMACFWERVPLLFMSLYFLLGAYSLVASCIFVHVYELAGSPA